MTHKQEDAYMRDQALQAGTEGVFLTQAGLEHVRKEIKSQEGPMVTTSLTKPHLLPGRRRLAVSGNRKSIHKKCICKYMCTRKLCVKVAVCQRRWIAEVDLQSPAVCPCLV